MTSDYVWPYIDDVFTYFSHICVNVLAVYFVNQKANDILNDFHD